MKKRFVAIWFLVALFMFIAPLTVSACGGFVAIRGERVFHSVYCDSIEFVNLDKLRWFDTAEGAKKSGLKMCEECSEYSDWDFDSDGCSTYWTTDNHLLLTAMEMSYDYGNATGHEAASEEYDWYYESGYEAGLEFIKSELESEYKTKVSDIEKQAKKAEEAAALNAYMISAVLGVFAISAISSYLAKQSRNEYEKRFRSDQLRNKAESEEILREERKIQLAEISEIRDSALSEIESKRDTLRHEKEDIDQFRRTLQTIVRQTKQNHPELARQIADAQYYLDMRSYNKLLYQKRPALKAAEEVKKIATEKRQLLVELKQLQYQLDFFEKLFPWLEEFKEVPSDEAITYATGTYGSEYDSVRKWLSPEEYEKLSDAEKFQRALDRWKSRKKTDWDIGIEYERYIGYRLECDGYKVKYLGATLGLKDMGRDLLATKNGASLVIQCKRWAKEKTIHEKHIFQLHGSVTVLSAENPGTQYKGVFITTAKLSDTARKCAQYCGIIIVEDCPMGDYPLIKCNANHDGEKIYHLPFDQQYDKIVVSKNRQSCYVWTTQEAEQIGFRRAYRWHPNKS